MFISILIVSCAKNEALTEITNTTSAHSHLRTSGDDTKEESGDIAMLISPL